MKTIIVIQARYNSTRLPGKVMMKVGKISLLELLISRLKRSEETHEIILATTKKTSDDELCKLAVQNGIKCYRGEEIDVLSRFYHAAKLYVGDIIVRITGDCPLADPNLIDDAIRTFRNKKVDYISNCNPPTYPDGLDIEVFSMEVLQSAYEKANSNEEREHVTPWMKNTDQVKRHCIKNAEDYSYLRWTVDEKEDIDLLRRIDQHLNDSIGAGWKEVLKLKELNPNIFDSNLMHKRNEGMKKSTGEKLWGRAKKVIPGGNMLLSKRAEIFLPNNWPTYYDSAYGCRVKDLDGRVFIDMSMMGIGTNTLGYAREEIDEAVKEVIGRSNMSTLNCPEEVYLAEKLVKIHPWANRVRFARTGGEANAIAIRIARAATGKDGVAICGYHGWHDWYLATNLRNGEGLDEHLLTGLKPKGVPKALQDTVYPFNYNDLEALKLILENREIGVVKMEVERNTEPTSGYLDNVRKLCTEKGVVLIFDECTSGFRETFGGLHKKYKVTPDICIFGKALGNGYAITAVIGKEEYMDEAQNTFISSTFWTERIGPTAALKTLEIMEREKSWEYITQLGNKVKESWKEIFTENDIEYSITGIASLAGFVVKNRDSIACKTLITQEMLKAGYLSGTNFYASTSHSSDIIKKYLEEFKKVIQMLSNCKSNDDLLKLIDGPLCHSGFERLN
ncbi:aminotransferase class III-fold pyridoxal phosphate-dependent enzyme [Synechococcus sp. CC9616]|uniref:aminotransferase class III-fold pyridoxal phosphate-dependent enzyme n=1 Tax=Synechococcus sp. CC9616 TaxID=110663 RepID=UPI00048E74A6|nr:aminotransferase class III-fold pyridoxal phosphate-dependent enzyme [Synechococcus sp. CC9616]